MPYRRGLLPDLSGVGVKGGFSARNERVTQLSPQRKGWVRDKMRVIIRDTPMIVSFWRTPEL
jgi:hypothetical protein